MLPAPDFRCVRLTDAAFAEPILVTMFLAEWEPYYGPRGPGDAEADVRACLSPDRLPIAVVALDADDQVLGTAALKTDSVGAELGVGPWLAALLVAPEHRRNGIGSALVTAIEAEAWNRGYEALYCATGSARRLLTRRGWQAYGVTRALSGRLIVYRLDRASPAR
jgi:GNAT superfamily N-acetyltransferase